MAIVIHCDGASRGNPGKAAAAFVVLEDGKIVFKSGKQLGKTTNNVAEYFGVIEALKWLRANRTNSEPLLFILDSQLIVNQLNGVYKIRDKKLQNLARFAKRLEKEMSFPVVFTSVPREKNAIADTLVNQILSGKIS